MRESTARHAVIIGGGIMGCTTAFYITHGKRPEGTTVTVIEPSTKGVAQGASGKAGGLVAKWAYPKDLVEESFEEHERLAEEYGGEERWGWRYVNCGSWEGKSDSANTNSSTAPEGTKKKDLHKTAELDAVLAEIFVQPREKKGMPEDLDWVKEELSAHYTPMAELYDTAQVFPYEFTTSMMNLAMEEGATLLSGRVATINKADGQVTGVTYIDNETKQPTTLSATDVVLCAGAWSSSLVPELPISSTRAHSIIIHAKEDVELSPYVLFTEIMLPSGETVTPEIYGRPKGEVYVCGPGDDSPLPATVDEVEVHKPACQSLWDSVTGISKELREGTLEFEQACYLPLLDVASGPVVGELSKVAKKLWVATGHSCWGICNAPGTARILRNGIMGDSPPRAASSLRPSKVLPGMSDD
ncbi:FAD dependent oxidoreductase [Pleurotus eryngii]|uniref:FAD dependent oxidoreductase n=1 Tax=Pleurotus eryngii TaxID=5323 RepID=A0A9P6DDB9_PLEER|nr:FAD dependent oxidoreductase [Pleurotus eryngii]